MQQSDSFFDESSFDLGYLTVFHVFIDSLDF